MRTVDAGHPDLGDDSVEPEPGEGDPAAVWRHLRIEVAGLGGGLQEGDHQVPLRAVGAHDPDRAPLEIRQAASEHDVLPVGGIGGLNIATPWIGDEQALTGSVGVHDPDTAYALRNVDPGEQEAGSVGRPGGPLCGDSLWLLPRLGEAPPRGGA